VSPPVEGVALPVDEPALLEGVENAHEAARVDAERAGDRRLGLAVAFAEDREDAVVVRLEALRLDPLERRGLEAVPEAGEEEAAVLDELPREPLDGRVGFSGNPECAHTGIIVKAKRLFPLSWIKATIGGCKK